MITMVWYQPMSSFPKWKARGVNTLVGYVADGTSLDDYKAAAKALGLSIILQADVCRDIDYIDPTAIAIINTPDEPDGAGSQTPQQMQARYAALKLKTNKPIFLNLDGHRFPFTQPATYIEYCKAGDWLAMDYYPCNFGDTPAAIPTIADRIKQLITWGGGKPVYAFLECSNQNLQKQAWVQGTPLQALMRGPTTPEFELEVHTAISAGVAGIGYFPDLIGAGWEAFDATPADIEQSMIKMAQNASHGTTPKLVLTVNYFSDGSSKVTVA
jgi:hypothetical protein